MKPAFRRAWTFRHGVLAQALTLAASFLPIIAHQDEVLIFVLGVTAPTIVVAQFATLAVAVRLPVLDRSQAVPVLATSLVMLALCATAILGLALLLFVAIGDGDYGKHLLAIAILLLGQGLYICTQAALTRDGKDAGVLQLRLVYAGFLFVLTSMLCFMHASAVLFVVATSTSYVIASFSVLATQLRRCAIFLNLAARSPWRAHADAARGGLSSSLAFTLAAVSAQAGALSIPSLGSMAQPWAIVTRIGSGFQTVGGQILAPSIDVKVSQSRRDSSVAGMSTALKGSILWSGLLGSLYLGAVGLALVYTGQVPTEKFAMFALVVAVVGYGLTSVILSPIDRALSLMGGSAARLTWDIARAFSTFAVLAVASGNEILMGLGTIGAITGPAYVYLSFKQLRKFRYRNQTLLAAASSR